jgi:predicted permease
MVSVLNRLLARIRNRRFDEDLAEELRFHEEMKRQDLEARGMDRSDARAAARRALGNTTLMREESRRVWIAPWLESIVQDVRYAVRSLLRQPLHSVTAVIVLVLAIGLNTSLFTFFKANALEPWPADDPERLVQIRATSGNRAVGLTLDEFRFMQQHAVAFRDIGALVVSPALMEVEGLADTGVQDASVTWNFLDLLGASVHLGRGFVRSDENAGQEQIPAVISDHLWRTYFAADPGIAGRNIRLNRKPFTIVGVLEPAVDGLAHPVDVWLPLAHAPLELPPPNACCVSVIGRLADGVESRRARNDLQLLYQQSASGSRGSAHIEVFGTEYISMPGASDINSIALAGLALMLLFLLACANVGNLQLARGFARRRELATRVAIGASRGRIVRQLLVEALVLSVAAGLLSIGAAAILPQAVLSIFGHEIPPTRVSRFRPDWLVIAFTAITSVVACVSVGLAPAVRSTRQTIPLGSLDRNSTPRLRFGLRGALLAAQIATCTVLLIAAGLVTRAISHALSFDPGFAVNDVLRVSAFLPRDTPDDQQNAFLKRLFAMLEQDAGEPIAVATQAPLVSADHARFYTTRIALPGQNAETAETVQRRSVSARYFDVLGIPIVKGRAFPSNATGEVLVNEAFARQFFPGEDAIGRTLRELNRAGAIAGSHVIVGIVRDAHLAGHERIPPLVFRPTTQGVFLTRGGPAAVEKIRTAALSLNAAVTVRAWPLADDLRDDLESSRQGAMIAWAIGLLGLTLATVGVFGVFAYSVEERRREIGVRLALGAGRMQIVALLLSASGRALTVGLCAGILLSLAAGPILRSYLFGLSAVDPLAYGLVLSILAAAAGVATLIPARRACLVDPARTLREE